MKKILFIEDDYALCIAPVIQNLVAILYPLTVKEVITSYPKMKSNKALLEKTKDLSSYVPTKDLYARALKKLEDKVVIDVAKSCKEGEQKHKSVKYDLVILDGDVFDGSTEKIFHIFDNKDAVLVHSAGYGFLERAQKAGFKNVFFKEFITAEKIHKNEFLKKIIEVIN